jgi:hypothetical protein
MLATQITTHVQDALARLLQQYQGRVRIAGVYTAFIQQIQDLEDAIYALDAGRQLWNGTSTPAVGAQLDGIGTLVGIDRNGLSDQEYILFIFGKIAENFSDSTVSAVLAVIGYVFQAELVLIEEIYPAGLYIVILNPAVPQSLFTVAGNLVQNAIGAGIRLVLVESDTLATFRYAGAGVDGATNGYADVNTPGTGGVYAGVISQ